MTFTVWTKIVEISFHRRKQVKQVWNDMRDIFLFFFKQIVNYSFDMMSAMDASQEKNTEFAQYLNMSQHHQKKKNMDIKSTLVHTRSSSVKSH